MMINYDYCTGRYWISTNLYDYCTGRYWISTNLDDCRETAVSSRAEAHASAVRQVYRDPSTFPLLTNLDITTFPLSFIIHL